MIWPFSWIAYRRRVAFFRKHLEPARVERAKWRAWVAEQERWVRETRQRVAEKFGAAS